MLGVLKLGATAAKGLKNKRFAGQALKGLREAMRTSEKSNLATDIALNFGMDAAYGVFQGAGTPGDMREKVLAGTTSAIGGGLGGFGLSAALPAKMRQNMAVRMPIDVVGGFAGDMAGQSVGDALQRMTSKDGKAAYERVGEEQREIERQTLQALGLAGYQPTDLLGYWKTNA